MHACKKKPDFTLVTEQYWFIAPRYPLEPNEKESVKEALANAPMSFWGPEDGQRLKKRAEQKLKPANGREYKNAKHRRGWWYCSCW